MRRWIVGSLCSFWVACGGGPDAVVDENDPVTSELRAREAQTTVWIQPLIGRQVEADGATRFLLSGRASRNVEDGLGFVLDDPYGELRLLSARRFALAFGTSELTNLVVGVPEFLRLSFTGGASTLFARLLTGPRLVAQPGSGLYFDGQPQTHFVDGRAVVRVLGHADRNLSRVEATFNSEVVTAQLIDPRHFSVDLTVDQFVALAGSRVRLNITGTAARSTVRRSATFDLGVRSLDLTTGDPYEVWPQATCQDHVRSCLGALPAGTGDTSACGSFLEVRACPLGVRIDQAAVDAARLRSAPALETLRNDAVALVGARSADLYGSVLADFEQVFLLEWGRGFATAAERDLYLDQRINQVFDQAYARPLDHVAAVDPLPGSFENARQVAADALLLHLANLDLTQSEWGRPLSVLTLQFRDRHLFALRELREVGPLGQESEEEWVFMTRWLDALVEINIDRRTGASTRILFEID
ncbi:MAG: hypothetical protein IPG45_29700 [Deltaproteobacteria bacterium]|nr:hypothetical protein [Deltaproteobacteria bacterium]